MLKCGVSSVLQGSDSAESDPVSTGQFALNAQSARQKVPGPGPNLRLVHRQGPLRAPQPGARENTRGRKCKTSAFGP